MFSAIAIFALVAAGCGSDDSSEEATTSVEEWTEFVRDNCIEVDERQDELGEPTSAEDAVTFLETMVALSEDHLTEEKALGTPSEISNVVERSNELRAERNTLAMELVEAIEDDDDARGEGLIAELDEIADELDDIADELGIEECRSDSNADGDDSGTSSGSGDEPFTYGDDAGFDALWDACEGGDPEACDELWLESPVDSEYEAFGFSCGERVPEGEAADCTRVMTGGSGSGSGSGSSNDGAFTYGDNAGFDALWDACDGGDPEACDDLWIQAPVDSEYEAFGFSCGGRVPEGEVEICSSIM